MEEGLFRPVRVHVDRERDEVRRSSKRKLTEDQVNFILVAGIGSIVLLTLVRVMSFSKYATLQPEDFVTYHATAPWFTLIGSILFMAASWLKGIRYWLIYATSGLAIVSSVVLIGLIQGWIHPHDLRAFDFGPSWWRG